MTRSIYCLILLALLVLTTIPTVLAPSAGATQEPSCVRKLDLSGKFHGLVYIDKDEKPQLATLAVENNLFSLEAGELKGSGIVSGVNMCGDSKVALKFTKTNDPRFQYVLNTGISLDARIIGGDDWSAETSVREVSKYRPVVFATARDINNHFAGPDVAFLICPEPPECKRYPRCPCADPTPPSPAPSPSPVASPKG